MTAEVIYWDRRGRRWDTHELATYQPVTLLLIRWIDEVERNRPRRSEFSSVSMSRLAQEPKQRDEYRRQCPIAAYDLISGRVTRSVPDPRWTLPRDVMDDVTWAAHKNMCTVDYIRDCTVWGKAPVYEKSMHQSYFDVIKSDPDRLKDYQDERLPRELFQLPEWYYFSSMIIAR